MWETTGEQRSGDEEPGAESANAWGVTNERWSEESVSEIGGSFAGTLLAALGTLGWRLVELTTRKYVPVPPLLTGVRVRDRIVPAVTAGAEDGMATLVIDVEGRHGDWAWRWRRSVV